MKPSENVSNHELSNNGKFIIDQSIPIEELMGSVTAYNNVEGDSKSLQLRTSARVFKKMKLDSANSIAAPVTVIPEKKEPVKEEIKEVKKPFRPLWTTEDKNLFFEALNEYGKDFEAIHLCILNKLKKRGLPEPVIKTKDQIRHFYYRTWHKISKHLKFSEDVKKLAQELYGLINFGELRKKIFFMSEKTSVKLNELIYRGFVTIRVKGKAVRVRTPMCRALRKLNQLDEMQDDLKLPPRVTLELQAKDMKTWMNVQQMAQNPRVKTTVPLQKRLSSVFQYLVERWKSEHAFRYENMLKLVTEDTKDLLPDEKTMETKKAILEPLLRLTPLSNCNVIVPTVNLSEFFTTHSICLNAYEERVGVKMPGEQLYQNLFSNFRTSSKGNTRKGGTKRSRNESTSEKNAKQSVTNQTDSNDNCVQQQDVEQSTPNVNQVVDQVVNTLLALKNETNENVDVNNDLNVNDNTDDLEEDIKKVHDIEKIRCGWTINDCGTLAVGDLYLMFGCDSKIVLEYSWDLPTNDTSRVNNNNNNNSNTKIEEKNAQENNVETTNLNNDNIQEEIDKSDHNVDLANTLKRLISLAKLHYRKNIVKCPCGHVCNGNKQNVSKTKPSIIKVVNKVPEHKTQETEVTTTNEVNTIPKTYQQITPAPLFRTPNVPNDMLRAQLDSIQRLKPRYCNRKGRPRAKQVVVERKLPVLANKGDTGRQILQMNIVTQDNITQPRLIAPKILETTDINQTQIINTTYMPSIVGIRNDVQTFCILQEDNISSRTINEPALITDNATTPSRVGSPTNLSNFVQVDISHKDNNILINVLPKDKIQSEPSFAGILSDDAETPTPPTSPSRILKENDNQWLNSEVVDFSLSSLLGQLDSPMKSQQQQQQPVTSVDDSRMGLSQDMDAQLQSLLMENSLDYMAKFADLAAQVVGKK